MKNRNRICEKWWVVAMMAMAVPALADSGVGLFKTQFNSVTTSSTLQWTNLKKEAMANYVVGADSEQGRIYLCRARHDGDMLLGQLRPEYTTCAVSGTKTYETFEVLENIENASLIIWKPWVKFDSKPNGAVVVDLAVDSVLIGRKKAESGFTYNIGRISYGSNIGHLNTFDDKNNELTADNGDILIEIEPVSYKLQNVVLDENTLHSRQTDPVIFQEFLLENKEEAAATVTMEVEYKFNYTVSWGHGHGISTGLDTDIEMADGSVFPRIRWANPFKEERKELFKLEKYLLPGTACNVTFRGNYTDRDVQYTAKLLTSYKDNLSRSREIHGERIENTVEVEAIYGEIFFTANNTLVPTTTTTTTSTTTSTTPLPPQTIPPSPEENNNIATEIKKPDHPEEVDNNMLGDSSEVPAKTPIIKEDIKTASVGGLGSKPNNANTRVFVLSLLMISPLFALLL